MLFSTSLGEHNKNPHSSTSLGVHSKQPADLNFARNAHQKPALRAKPRRATHREAEESDTSGDIYLSSSLKNGKCKMECNN